MYACRSINNAMYTKYESFIKFLVKYPVHRTIYHTILKIVSLSTLESYESLMSLMRVGLMSH